MKTSLRKIDFIGLGRLKTESVEIEYKLAAGRDGTGEVPSSVWESYSAMANTAGGVIVLGVEEKPGMSPVFRGIKDPDKVVRNFWNQINNPTKVSCNLLKNDDVAVKSQNGVRLVVIRVPRAARKQKPIYLGGNPFGGTFRRLNEGDFRCPESAVRRMIAENELDTRDDIVFEGTTLADLDASSLKGYRQMFLTRQPSHPFNKLSDLAFLRMMGGYADGRAGGGKGLTLAGLLMFGKLRSILDAVPNYVVDYREIGEDEETRWIDRVTTDYTWPGNLFEFASIVISKLYPALKVPFRLEHGVRVDESPAHVAVREAVVNTLIHADYSGTTPIVILKRPDRFVFRNPGTLRMPVEDVLKGGSSDCRNRNLQKMFQFIGFAEQAGSGYPKIFAGWKTLGSTPVLREDFSMSQTYLTLMLRPDDVSVAPAGDTGTSKGLGEKHGTANGTVSGTVNGTEKLILAALVDSPRMPMDALAARCGVSRRTVARVLAVLKEKGAIRRIGPDKGGHWEIDKHFASVARAPAVRNPPARKEGEP